MTPFVNIPDYPDVERVLDAIAALPRHVLVDAERLARAAGSARAENVVMIGAAEPYLPFGTDSYREFIAALFRQKKQSLVDINLKAFDLGVVASRSYSEFLRAGLAPREARALARCLDFGVDPRPAAAAWFEAFHGPTGPALAAALAELKRPFPGTAELAGRVAALGTVGAADVAALLTRN